MAVGSRGLAGVHKRSEEIYSERRTFGLQRRTFEFRWDGSKSRAENQLNLRILGDDIMIATQQHRFVPLGDNKYFTGVCRKAFPIEDTFCYVCDVLGKEFTGDAKERRKAGLNPTDVAVALAVQMDSLYEGKVWRGYQVKMIEWEIPQLTDEEKNGKADADAVEYRELLNRLGKPGTKVNIPAIGLMVGTLSGQQALFDFATRRPTISDRVYEISRDGKGLETKWDWNHDGSDKEMPDPSEMLASFRARYPFELPEEWAHRNGSTDRYNFFFKLTGDTPAGVGTVNPDDDAPAPASDARENLMKRLNQSR